MKRVLGALLVVAVIAYIPVSSLVSAEEPAGKILLCHFKGNSGEELGRIINPNLHSSQVHILMHGDLEFPTFTPKGPRANMCIDSGRVWVCRDGKYRFPAWDDGVKDVAKNGNCFVGIEEFPLEFGDDCDCSAGISERG